MVDGDSLLDYAIAMDFRSDNVAAASPEILAALAAANHGAASAYGEDAISRRMERRFSELFEREVAVFPVATGTAANALALASVVPPWGQVFAHRDAHIATDECGAPEFFTGGAKITGLEGGDGRISPAAIETHLRGGRGVHHVQPAAISLSQATEAGTLYRPADIAAIAALAREHGLYLHMDGARFANAVASMGCSPAEITWRAGIDVLSFGATKNGALAAEAVLFFDPAKAREVGFRRKRAGHLISKMRFLSAQLDAYLTDGLWLRNAAQANKMADQLGRALAGLAGVRLCHPVEANELFVELPAKVITALEVDGFCFYRWGEVGENRIRLVTSFATRAEDVAALIAAVDRHLREGS